MAADEELNALSTTDASNTPAGGDTIGSTLDDELRSIKANIARAARWEVTATVSAAATLTETVLHKIVPVSGSAGGATTITLPTAGSAGTGFAVMALKTDTANNVVLDPNGSTIDGAANYTMTQQYETVVMASDGAAWFATGTGKRALMPALSVDGGSTLSGAVTMKTTLAVDGAATFNGSLTVSATALFTAPVTMAGAVVVTGDADFQGAANVGTLTASATAVFKSKISVSATASVGALTIAGVAYPTSAITLGTEQASTSGTEVDFTGIPSGTKRITVMLEGVSTDGTSAYLLRLGDAGGIEETSTYSGGVNKHTGSGNLLAGNTTGFGLTTTAVAARAYDINVVLTLKDSVNNTWCALVTGFEGTANQGLTGAGHKSLSAELTQLRITTVNGTDAFDAGSINIAYE